MLVDTEPIGKHNWLNYTTDPTTLLRVCRQIYNEASSIYYGGNTFLLAIDKVKDYSAGAIVSSA